MIKSFTIDELFLEVEQCSKYDVVLPKHIAISVLAKLRAAEVLAKASRPVAHMVVRTLKDTKTQIAVHSALEAYDKAGVTE